MSSLGAQAAISDLSDLVPFYRPRVWHHKVNPATPRKINARALRNMALRKLHGNRRLGVRATVQAAARPKSGSERPAQPRIFDAGHPIRGAGGATAAFQLGVGE